MYSCVDSKVFVALKCTPSFLKVDTILNLCQWLTIFSGNMTFCFQIISTVNSLPR